MISRGVCGNKTDGCKCDLVNGIQFTGEYCEVGESTVAEIVETAICFAESELINLESGETKAISEIRVGDRVMTSDKQLLLSFSTVIAVPHSRNKFHSPFVIIRTADDGDITLSPDHLILSGVCGLELRLQKASSVVVGGCLQGVAHQTRITSVEQIGGSGVYTIVTNNALLVVNGFVASSFAINDFAGNFFYDFLRAVRSIHFNSIPM